MTRRIAHLDMDAFFASVSLLRHPQLRGLPVVIGGRRVPAPAADRENPHPGYARLRDYAGRGVVTTATYEARALGVHSAMGLMKAAALAPDALLLPADFEDYRRYSGLFKEAVRAIAPRIEDRGIDEIYIDLSAHEEPSAALAGRLKRAVAEATGLRCSIGVAPNKLLAKLASELDKPDGLTVLEPEDIERRIWPLAVGKVNGIGPKSVPRLNAQGIHTVGDLARVGLAALVGHFGARYGAWLWDVARGHDERPLVTERDPKSMSRERTFARDLHPRQDREALSEILLALCKQVSADLERKGLAARTVSIKLRYADFRTVSRDHTLPAPTADAQQIRAAARTCLRRVPLDQRIRLLGVRAAGLAARGANADAHPEPEALPLFAE